jgi:MrfA Zn-binding domain
MEPIRHDLRLSETVSPFGVGAIVDVRGESLIAPDTSWWDKRFAPEISCDRLLSRLGPGVLRQAPSHAGTAAKETPSLRYWRFPAWRFCEQCGKVSKLTGKSKGKWINRCDCGGALVPMRYVSVCAKGSHIQDVPWFMWTHRGHDAGVTEEVRFCKAYKELRFVRSARLGEGLKALSMECTACRRSRSLVELVVHDALTRDGIKCSGTQPWIDLANARACEHKLVAVQRGATGNYLAERLSALDIPEEQPASVELADKVRAHVYFDKVVADNGGPQAQMVAEWIATEVGVTPETVLEIAAGSEEGDDDQRPLLGLKDGEWAAFVKKLEDGRDRSGDDFVVDGWVVETRPTWPVSLTDLLAAVGQVRRVREVRALKGFRRHSPDADFVSADLGPDQKRRPTYPAIEVFGEGVFLRLDEQRLQDWEQLPDVRARASILARRRSETPWAQRLDVPEPRYVALHTLSHLLMRRLAFDSGYASASLQERIYANSNRTDRTAGILIYTAAGDAQGTLGGLVRLAAPDKLIPMLVAALDEADVCSNDPVCIESDRQGSSSLNLSACHGCCLVSETSCESGNRLLDRQLVIGGKNVEGLLGHVLVEVRELGYRA